MPDPKQPLVLKLSVADFWRPLLAEGDRLFAQYGYAYHTGVLLEFRDGRSHELRDRAAVYHAFVNPSADLDGKFGFPVYHTPSVGGGASGGENPGMDLFSAPGCEVGRLSEGKYAAHHSAAASEAAATYSDFEAFDDHTGFVVFTKGDIEFLLASYPGAESLYLSGCYVDHLQLTNPLPGQQENAGRTWGLKLEMPLTELTEEELEGLGFINDPEAMLAPRINLPPMVYGVECAGIWPPKWRALGYEDSGSETEGDHGR